MTDPRRWYHIILTTYGAWLYGDARGFRTRHHREHVEGDYKNPPPPGKYQDREEQSRKSLEHEPPRLSKSLRPVVGVAVKERLETLGATVVCVAVSGQHVHFLAKMIPSQVRDWTGAVKRHAWFVLRERGWSGKLWGKGRKTVPIKDRRQQLNAYQYILDHADEGAWTWRWGQRL
jgi:hypothetical protein